MTQNHFIIRDGKLLLKTVTRDYQIDSKITLERLQDLATDLVGLTLEMSKQKVDGVESVWLGQTERKVLYMSGKGRSIKRIAESCKIDERSVRRALARAKAKIAAAHRQEQAEPSDKEKYVEVPVLTEPFSTLVDEDGVEIEWGDEGKASETEIVGKLENDLEESELFKIFADYPRVKEFLRLYEQGYSREECAEKMGITRQAINALVQRIRKKLKQCPDYLKSKRINW